MEIQSLFLLKLYIIFSITNRALCLETCKPTSCSRTGPIVRFPFRLGHQSRQCGYPGFDLSCINRTRLIINLNFAGDFVVTDIDYISQTMYVKPEFCPPTTIDLIPLGSPFNAVLLEEYLVYNCSAVRFFPSAVPFEVVNCISTGANATGIAVPSSFNTGFVNQGLLDSCQKIHSVDIAPVGFSWGVPFCGRCERRNGICGYKNVETMETGCSVSLTSGLSTAAKYGVIVGAGLPAILLLICLTSIVRKKFNDQNRIMLRHHLQNFPTTISPQPPRSATGLDKLTIDSYPMTVLGESKRLPKPSDSTCAICLSEYKPNDTLRTVPECNHYFHSNCIDEWLKLNATCPVCRNFPERSSGRAATDPMSSSSSPTSLFSN